ncbi:MAG: hypothetical protein JWL74_1509 [Alphaproteobacteria bacterium]|jgi:predicted flap endonuclease-1-like 5' DNA nuclease|nr:hypothetical protein [Alphaproteobacteria bacterium]
MMTVIDANIVPLIVALLIGLAIGWWMFGRSRSAAATDEDRRTQMLDVNQATASAPPRAVDRQRPIRDGLDTHEGRGIADHGASATTDVAGQILSVDTHEALPDAGGPPDNLQMLKGVGPKLALRLNENGIFRFDQLAGLSQNEVTNLDERMGPFRGRIARDRVVEQAAYLARGDRDGFEARFGRLGGTA